MDRYKAYDLNQAKMIPSSYSDQIVEGSFEHALNEIVEEHLRGRRKVNAQWQLFTIVHNIEKIAHRGAGQ